MAGVNKVILIGNLGKDPEVRHLEGGTTVANFPLATTETYKDKTGARQEQTEWHNIVLWRSLADVAEKYLKKGMQIYVEGKLRTRSWEDKEGHKRYTTEVVAEDVSGQVGTYIALPFIMSTNYLKHFICSYIFRSVNPATTKANAAEVLPGSRS